MSHTHVRVPRFSDTGESLDITNFVYDPTIKRWEHRMRIAQLMVQKYTSAVVSDSNFVPVAVPILKERGFNPEEAAPVTQDHDDDDDEGPVAVAAASAAAPERTGKRGRQSKYPYKTMQIGESFQIDEDSVGVTLNHSLLGDRGFEIKVVKGRFTITRTR